MEKSRSWEQCGLGLGKIGLHWRFNESNLEKQRGRARPGMERWWDFSQMEKGRVWGEALGLIIVAIFDKRIRRRRWWISGRDKGIRVCHLVYTHRIGWPSTSLSHTIPNTFSLFFLFYYPLSLDRNSNKITDFAFAPCGNINRVSAVYIWFGRVARARVNL